MTAPFNPNLPANLPPKGPLRVVYLEANRPPRTGTSNDDTKYRDGSYYEPNTEWRDNSVNPPNIWKLSKINSKTSATWFLVMGSSGNVTFLKANDGNSANPDGSDGHINVFGSTVANATHATPLFTIADNNQTLTSDIQVATAVSGTPPDKNDAGIVSLEAAQFSVNPDGYVTLKGGSTPPVLTETVDTFTAPAVTATVVPNGSGDIRVRGSLVSAGTNPLRTNSHAASEFTVEVQTAQAIAAGSTNSNLNGVSHYDNAMFTVSPAGLVQLAGGLAAVEEFTVDAVTAPGVNPVTPSAGNVTVSAFAVAAHSVPLETRTRSLNHYAIEAQYSSAVAATDATKSGLSHYDSAQFGVDANGFVTLAGSTGPAATKFDVDTTSGSGVDPTIPSATGVVAVTGAQVAAGTVGTNVIRTDATLPNSITWEIQRSTAAASSTMADNGVSHYSSSYFTVDSNGFVQSKSGLSPGFSNLGFTYNAGTGLFSITAADGTALSASNPGYVTIQTSNPGQLVTVAITANQAFIDHNGASTIIGNLFGLPTGVAYAQDIPFSLYAALKSDATAINFGISRYWAFGSVPIAARLGKDGTATADVTGSLFLFGGAAGTGGPTLANYDSQPILRIGRIRMRMNASDDWTVQTLDLDDKLQVNYQLNGNWVFPTGAFGASSGTFFMPNGGTAPTFSTNNTCVYSLCENGYVNFLYSCVDGGAGVAGVGSVQARLSMPFSASSDKRVDGSGTIAAAYSVGVMPTEQNASKFMYLTRMDNLVVVQNQDFTGAGKEFYCSFSIVALVSV